MQNKLRFDDVFDNKADFEEIKNYLIHLHQKGESTEDIVEAAKSMKMHMIKINTPDSIKDKLLDNCGTGGDESNSFNISTTVSIVLSSCGSIVAKHGNRSITSKSGSADLLEALGVSLDLNINNQAIMLEKCGFAFIFAVNHHPCMKHIMPIRKSIPHRTIFNILGPLANPAMVKNQLIGVFSKEYISKMIKALKTLGSKRAMIVSSKDGLDEISMSDITYASKLENNKITSFEINPEEFGFELCNKDDIKGGDAKYNAAITMGILDGSIIDAKRDIVLINTAAALWVDKKVDSINDGIIMAEEAINSKKSLKKLEEIIRISNDLAS